MSYFKPDPTFDSLSPMTTSGDTIYGGTSGTGTRLAKGSDGTVYTMASGLPSWASPGNITVVSKVTTYSIASTDGVILCSGSAFTATLPTAASAAGEQHRIIKTDSSLTNIVTVGTTSSQTIGAGGATTFVLSTQGENLVVVSDGANWQILEHFIPTAYASYTPTLTGFGTPTNVNFHSWRTGNLLNVQGFFTAGSCTATEARCTMGFAGTDNNVTSISGLPTVQMCGKANTTNDITTDFSDRTVLIEASKGYVTFGKNSSTTNGLTKANGNAVGVDSNNFSFFAQVPITGWAVY